MALRRHPFFSAAAGLGELPAAAAIAGAVVMVVALRPSTAARFDGGEDGGEDVVEDRAAAREAGAGDADVGFNDCPEGGDDVIYTDCALVTGHF